MDSLSFAAAGISVSVDLTVGHIAALEIEREGRRLAPLHRAPWVDEPDTWPADIAAGLARLSGDFLCAPFSANDIDPAPGHGWPGNSRWEVVDSAPVEGGWRAHLRLARPVMGAVVEKLLTLRDGHPFLYQEHAFIGGEGRLPAAHHPMTRMAGRGSLSFSPKRLALTLDQPLEPGRHALAYPARIQDLGAFPARDGGTVDLAAWPLGSRNEDFLTLIEAAHGGFGWTAVARDAEADLLLVLKDPADLPITMLWISNGGRDQAPWNGRHVGVLGVEDGRTAVGHAASLGDNPLARLGVPTAFDLVPDGRVSFRHVIGAVPWSGRAPRSLAADGATLVAAGEGAEAALPFDRAFLGKPAP